MKTRILLTALALPAIFAACTNDELVNDVQNNGRELLSKDFSIIATKTDALESRGQWAQETEDGTVSYKFNWKNASAADKIGLCWTGAATAADGTTDVSVANPNNMALSNYEFVLTHYTNGKAVGDGFAESPYATEKTANFGNGNTYNGYKTAKFAVTGVTPFTGEYVMYYPYNASLKNVGYLPVSVSANQVVADINLDKQLVAFGNVTTCISNPYEFSSSTTAADVDLYPYTTGLLLRMYKAEGSADVNVKRIMLVAADGKSIINEQTLDLTGAVKTSKGVTVMTLTLPDDTKATGVKGETGATPVEALMAVLPQTLKMDEVEVLFVNSASKAYSYPLTKDLTLTSGQLRAPNIVLDAEDFTLDIISDETALTAAINAVTTSAATVSTYKNVPVTFASAATFTNTKKATVSAEKIVFSDDVTFSGDIEFTCPVEFKKAVIIGDGVTVTLADGTVFETTSSLTMNANTDENVSALNLKATTIKSALTVNTTDAAVNFVSGTSDLNAIVTVGTNGTLNIKSGATVNAKVSTALTNKGNVTVEEGGALVVAAKYTPTGGTEIIPSISNANKLYVNGTLTNNSIVNNTGTLQTSGAGVINNNLTINNNGQIVLMQAEGVALNQAATAAVNDFGTISGINRISGGDLVIEVDGTNNTLESALANPKYTNHTAFRVTAAQTVTTLVNTTKKLILEADLTLNGTASTTADNETGAIEINDAVTITSIDKLNVTGDMTIAATKSLTIGDATNVTVSGKIINNGTFTIATPANSYVFCSGIESGAAATWNPTPQW